MKKTILSFSIIFILFSCADGDSEKGETKTDGANTAPAAKAEDPDVAKGLDLIAKSDCLTCHKINDPLTGPSYVSIASRYASNSSTNIEDSLANKIIKGGAGNWGTIPMTPHPALSQEDAKTMVKYVLSLKE